MYKSPSKLGPRGGGGGISLAPRWPAPCRISWNKVGNPEISDGAWEGVLREDTGFSLASAWSSISVNLAHLGDHRSGWEREGGESQMISFGAPWRAWLLTVSSPV